MVALRKTMIIIITVLFRIGIWYKDELATITVERQLVPKVELYTKDPDHKGLEMGVAVAKVEFTHQCHQSFLLRVTFVTGD